MFLTNIINEELINNINNNQQSINLYCGIYKIIIVKKDEKDIDFELIKNINVSLLEYKIQYSKNINIDIYNFNLKLINITRFYTSIGLEVNIFIDIKLFKKLTKLITNLQLKNDKRVLSMINEDTIIYFTDKVIDLLNNSKINYLEFEELNININNLKFYNIDKDIFLNFIEILNKNFKKIHNFKFNNNYYNEFNIIVDRNNYIIDGLYNVLNYKLLNNNCDIKVIKIDNIDINTLEFNNDNYIINLNNNLFRNKKKIDEFKYFLNDITFYDLKLEKNNILNENVIDLINLQNNLGENKYVFSSNYIKNIFNNSL